MDWDVCAIACGFLDRTAEHLSGDGVAGGLLADAMLRVFPGSDAQQVTDAAFLIWHLGEATMRLAISCAPEEGRRLVEAFKRMSLGGIMAPATMSTSEA